MDRIAANVQVPPNLGQWDTHHGDKCHQFPRGWIAIDLGIVGSTTPPALVAPTAIDKHDISREGMASYVEQSSSPSNYWLGASGLPNAIELEDGVTGSSKVSYHRVNAERPKQAQGSDPEGYKSVASMGAEWTRRGP